MNRAITAEKSRLDHKKHYKVVGTGSSRILDDLTSYTAGVLNMQIAVINFVDGDNLWPKKLQPNSKFSDLYKESNVCSLAVLHEMADFVEDQLESPALITNPVIAAEMGMRFYKAVPIILNEGLQIGTICVMHKEYKELFPKEREKLNLIASIIARQMDKRIDKKNYA